MVCLFVCFRERQGRGFSLVSQGWMFGKKDYVQHVFTVCVCVCFTESCEGVCRWSNLTLCNGSSA